MLVFSVSATKFDEWSAHVAGLGDICAQLDGDELVEAASDYLRKLDSQERAVGMIHVLRGKDPAAFWKVFLDHWPMCDATWNFNRDALRQLKTMVSKLSPVAFYKDDARAFYEQLPERITIYRGSQRQHVRGISWTTDKAVAEQFAFGHRGITAPDAVVATGTILKSQVLAVFVERRESEIVCAAPRDLQLSNVN